MALRRRHEKEQDSIFLYSALKFQRTVSYSLRSHWQILKSGDHVGTHIADSRMNVIQI